MKLSDLMPLEENYINATVILSHEHTVFILI